jgi:hypothetical protein
VTSDAVDIHNEHEAGRFRESNPASATVEFLRSQVNCLHVAPAANGEVLGENGDLPDFMFKRCVTTRALDLVIGHVVLVKVL